MRLPVLISLVASLVPLAWAQDADLKTVQAYFEKYNIPEDLGINFNPTQLLNLYFPQVSGPVSGPLPVKIGATLPRNATAGPVRFSLSNGAVVNPVAPKYVIIAVDPDAPTPENPTNAQIRHLLGGNFVPSTVASPCPGRNIPFLINTTAAISDYRQPTPPPSALGSPHRYIFLAYRQSQAFSDQTLVTPQTPINLWNLVKFTEAVGLGDPVGGTFFLVKPELLVEPGEDVL